MAPINRGSSVTAGCWLFMTVQGGKLLCRPISVAVSLHLDYGMSHSNISHGLNPSKHCAEAFAQGEQHGPSMMNVTFCKLASAVVDMGGLAGRNTKS